MKPLLRRASSPVIPTIALTAALIATVLSLSGCLLRAPGGNGNGNGDNQIAVDQQAYITLQHQLEAGRTQAFDKGAMELYGTGNTLYWKTYPGFSPILHRRDDVSQAAVAYSFGIGGGDDNNYRASTQMVVSAERSGGNVIYHVFDATKAQTSLGDVVFAAPTDQQKWWAYAVNGSSLYVVTTGTATTLYRWTLGNSSATQVTTLESAGASVGEFLDFDVDGDTMVFIESGRLWKLGIAANHATYLQNKTEIAGAVNFTSDGVVFEDATGLKDFVYASAVVRDLSAEIHASGYQLNSTYASAHEFYSATTSDNFTRWNNWVVYTANSGIFAFNLGTKAVTPILLTPIDDQNLRTEYRYPVTLDDGACYVVGLQSTSGSVGADGPVFRVPLGL